MTKHSRVFSTQQYEQSVYAIPDTAPPDVFQIGKELLSNESRARDVLGEAAAVGCVDMWEAATEAMMHLTGTRRLEETVGQHFAGYSHAFTVVLLSLELSMNTPRMLDAVVVLLAAALVLSEVNLRCIQYPLYPLPTQVRQNPGLLQVAVGSEDLATLRAVLSVVRKHLPVEQVSIN